MKTPDIESITVIKSIKELKTAFSEFEPFLINLESKDDLEYIAALTKFLKDARRATEEKLTSSEVSTDDKNIKYYKEFEGIRSLIQDIEDISSQQHNDGEDKIIKIKEIKSKFNAYKQACKDTIDGFKFMHLFQREDGKFKVKNYMSKKEETEFMSKSDMDDFTKKIEDKFSEINQKSEKVEPQNYAYTDKDIDFDLVFLRVFKTLSQSYLKTPETTPEPTSQGLIEELFQSSLRFVLAPIASGLVIIEGDPKPNNEIKINFSDRVDKKSQELIGNVIGVVKKSADRVI